MSASPIVTGRFRVARTSLTGREQPVRNEGLSAARSRRSSAAGNFARADARTTAVRRCPYGVKRCSVWELQFALDRLEARLIAQWVEQRGGLETLQAGSTQALGCFEPLQGLRGISPLRVDHGVHSRTTVTP